MGKPSKPLLGAHMSIAGGYYKAVLAAAEAGCDVVQIFTKNNNQWRAKPIAPDEQAAFREALAQTGVRHPIAHTSYLLNLASPDRELRKKSVDGFVAELYRAELLGLEHVVIHPGSYVSGTERQGIRRVITSLNHVLRRAQGLGASVLLETTAGQGSALGWRFEQLAAMLSGLKEPERVGICVDTCHVFSAGYPIHTRSGYSETIDQLDALVGVDKVKAFHLNDSKRDLGSRVDRHANIGRGKLGWDAFRLLLRDRRFRLVPMYLETPKGTENGEDLDVINLRALRALAANSRRRGA